MKLDLKFGFRLAVPVMALVLLLGWLSGPFAGHLIKSWSVKDLDIRSRLITASLGEGVRAELGMKDSARVRRQFENIVKDERIHAVGFCDATGAVTNASADFVADFKCTQSEGEEGTSDNLTLPSGKHLHISRVPLAAGTDEVPQGTGQLVVVQTLAYAEARAREAERFIQKATIFATLGLAVFILLVSETTRRLWIEGVRKGIVGWSGGHTGRRGDFEPIISDVRKLISQLESERKVWNADAIRQLISGHLNESEIFVVSNREPYIHHKLADGTLELERPASGLVTALEPIVGVCNGTWIAHGSGSGDRETVDASDCVMVPPENPSFRLKRVWITAEEKEGYYNGFSNEALWPLCLLTHTRPIFRTTDWEMYRRINQRFADAVVAEAKSPNPLVLVQDYHFALAPRMIREQLPEANIITFWHIPWPNPEIFGICPWREEILDGLLGSQIIGFHTSAHVQNFLHSVQQTLESRVDLVSSRINYRGAVSRISAYPMSIEWQSVDTARVPIVPVARQQVLKENNLPDNAKIGVGIDRLDYTKGILERLQAVERLIELYPEWRGRFTFIQVAAPSRTEINAYQDYAAEIHREVERINGRFGDKVPLVILREFHHSKETVYKYYRAADICFVSSLHDGMNLVAKEFVASREDEQGVLVLSRFTGAAVSFPDALLINPYHIDACAEALVRALQMHPAEQRERMSAMRRHVREHNIFRWAGHLLLDSAEVGRLSQIAANEGGGKALVFPYKRKGGA